MNHRSSLPQILVIAIALSLASNVNASDLSPAPTPSPLPALGKTAADFAPRGWKVLAEKRGDIDGDGRKDLVVVLAREDEEKLALGNEGGPDRPLLLALAKKDGTFRRVAVTSEAVLHVDEGGAFGDPFDSVWFTATNLIVASHYAGARERWTESRYFRLEKGALEWVCSTHSSFDAVDDAGPTTETIDGPHPELCKPPKKRKRAKKRRD